MKIVALAAAASDSCGDEAIPELPKGFCAAASAILPMNRLQNIPGSPSIRIRGGPSLFRAVAHTVQCFPHRRVRLDTTFRLFVD